MNILVTGSHGYIGAIAAPALRAAGHSVTGLDTHLFAGCDLFPYEPDLPLRRVDVRDVSEADLRGFDAIVHLAGLSNDPLGDMNADWTYDVNLHATIALARAAREAGVSRFVFASSCSMYGASGEDDLVGEDAPLKPLTAYAESKVRAEEGLAELAGDGFSPVFMRFATAYGLSPRLRVDIVVNNLVAWAHTTKAVRILSDGTPWRPLAHVRDLTSAVQCVLEAPVETIHNDAFNIGANSENYQVREIGEIVRETVPGCSVEYAGTGEPDARSYRVDFGKFARTFPDFRTQWTVRKGAAELYDAYRANGLTLEDFEGDRYVRLRRLTSLLDGGVLDDDLRHRDALRPPAEARA